MELATNIQQTAIRFMINTKEKAPENNADTLKQFSVVWVDLPKYSDSRDRHIQSGKHPAIIMSNNECNKHSPVVNVIPLTSKDKAPWLPTHYKMTAEESLSCGLKKESVIMAEGYVPIGKQRVLGVIGKLSEELILKTIKVMFSQLGLCFDLKE